MLICLNLNIKKHCHFLEKENVPRLIIFVLSYVDHTRVYFKHVDVNHVKT